MVNSDYILVCCRSKTSFEYSRFRSFEVRK